jgi:hypothetical protein
MQWGALVTPLTAAIERRFIVDGIIDPIRKEIDPHGEPCAKTVYPKRWGILQLHCLDLRHSILLFR